MTANEPSIEDTIELLKGIKEYYEEYHKLYVSDDILRSCAVLSERYITDRYLPDKAIDLLDEAAACASINSSRRKTRLLRWKKTIFLPKPRTKTISV